MRVIAQIPHPIVRISVFQMNEKFMLKMELGPFEQTYKMPEEDIQSLEQLQDICNPAFMEKVLARFVEMKKDLDQALEKK